jgi:hypothetical protein
MSTPPLRLRPPGCWSLEYARQRLKLAATHRSEWDRLVNALDPDDARAIVDGTQEVGCRPKRSLPSPDVYAAVV